MSFKSVKSIIQIDSMDEDLRTGLWNNFLDQVWKADYFRIVTFQKYTAILWGSYFKRAIDTSPTTFNDITHNIRKYFFMCEWLEIYDFIEFIAKTFPDETISKYFINACNSTLERELSAYRFIGYEIAQITSDQEIAEIEEALNISSQFTQHLHKSLELFADRKSPDYKNSIKESISAVEAICKLITGDSKITLGDALRQLESKLGTMHPSLRNAFNQLYGYTSDAEGIRHSMLGKSNLDIEDAKFMLTACSAFINYLVAKADKAGINIYQK